MRANKVPRGLVSAAAIVVMLAFGISVAGSASAPANDSEVSLKRLSAEIEKQKEALRQLVTRLEAFQTKKARAHQQHESPHPQTDPRPGEERSSRRDGELATSAPDPVSPPSRQTNTATISSDAPDPPTPGPLPISDGDVERALERTLVATGNLLVPNGFAELEPQFAYTRREVPTSVLFRLDRNEFQFSLNARIGLPWQSQLEISLPYNLAQEKITDVFVSPAQQVSDHWGQSAGDILLGFAKTLIHERGWLPDLIGRVTYQVPSGPRSNNDVPLPSGRSAASFAVTALRRQDPLVFIATAGYTKAFESDHVNPGDQINVQLGAFLATSPQTTLRSVLQQNFMDDMTVRGVRIPGSGGVESVLTFGGSSILYRRLLVDLQVGVGLTNAAPKYSVILSTTYRFGIP